MTTQNINSMENNNKVLIVGAQGHAKVILDILEENNIAIAGLIDDYSAHSLKGHKVIGTTSDLRTLYKEKIASHAFVAIGDNAARQRITGEVLKAGFSMINAISPHSILSKWVQFGEGIAVLPGAIINADACIGSGAIINTGVSVDHDCMVGDFVHLAPGTAIAGGVQIDEGAFLGTGARVIPGIKIGAWCTIGAGAVLIRDVPDSTTAVGVPARPVDIVQDVN